MLNSDRPEDRKLTMTGPSGVELEVFNGRYDSMGRGSDKLALSLPKGIYTARWRTAAQVQDEVVDLVSVRSARVRCPDSLREASSVGLSNAGPKSRRRDKPATIVVLEQSLDPRLKGVIGSGVRLYDGHDVAMRSDTQSVTAVRNETGADDATGAGWALRVYPVDPGLCRLRYETVDGGLNDQVVPALYGRRTVVILRQVTSRALVRQDGTASMLMRRGSDPARTVIVSTPQQQQRPPSVDHVVVAETLLAGLMRGTGVLTPSIMDRVLRDDADPLLKLYAAANILQAAEAGYSPDLATTDGRMKTRSSASRSTRRADARHLLKSLTPDVGVQPDAILLRRALSKLSETSPTCLPLLAASLRWLEPQDGWLGLPGETTGGDAGTTNAGPWVVRLASASKGGEVTSNVAPAAEVPEGWVWAVSSLLGLGGATCAMLLIDVPDQLGLISTSAALAVFASLVGLAATAFSVRESFRALQAADAASVTQFKAAFVDAIPDWLPHREAVEVNLKRRAMEAAPPYLRRPVLHPDDRNKNRFGGAPERLGFRLSASFERTDDPDWIEVTLILRVAPGDERRAGQIAQFFLHESYSEPRVVVPIVKGKADLVVRANGGFTVGVWLPGQRVELELDLAELPDAPQRIKDW